MKEPIIDINKVIIIEPQIYVWGVYCKTKKEQRFYKIVGIVATICGVIGVLGLIAMISYFYFL
jgi:hypothetical protein